MRTAEQRRALVVFFVVLPLVDVLLLVLFQSDGFEHHPGLALVSLLLISVSVLGLIGFAMEPFRRAHLREVAGKDLPTRWKAELRLIATILLIPPVPLHPGTVHLGPAHGPPWPGCAAVAGCLSL